MSRIGKKPIPVPAGVTVGIEGRRVTVKGPKGELSREIPDRVEVVQEGGQVLVKPLGNDRRSRAMWGLARTLVDNMVVGVSKGFSRDLLVQGVGYRVQYGKDNRWLLFNLGYSHPILYELPEGVSADIDTKANKISLKGIDKEKLGLAAATIRAFRPPEPYKGKGIRYADEVVRRKMGKSGAK